MNPPPTTLTNHNPPATIGCGLNPNPIRREESDTPQALVVGVPGEDVSQRVGVDAVETQPGDEQPTGADVTQAVLGQAPQRCSARQAEHDVSDRRKSRSAIIGIRVA